MTSRAAQLAVLLRRVQWECDETAHALPEGRVTEEHCQTLATALEELATTLRERAGASAITDSTG